MPSYDLSDQETVDEVRAALAFLTEEEVPDESILYSVNRIAKPWVESQAKNSLSGDKYEAAILTYGAELSFASWMSTTRMGDSELQVYKDPRVYKNKLEQRSDAAFSSAGMTRPPRVKHHQDVAKPDHEQ